jgi:hypothetical protein
MPRCPACREWIQGDRDRVGSRCPHCRLPLYERPELFKQRPDSREGRCSLHANNPALGACQRCGNFQCDLCRTRWRGRWLCAACVDRALEAGAVRPEEQTAHLWEAILALVLGILAWLTLVTAVVLIAAVMANGGDPAAKENMPLVALGGLLLLGSMIPSVFGTGLGAAALYTRGNHMILATIGLLLSGVHIGTFVGLFTFQVWSGGG